MTFFKRKLKEEEWIIKAGLQVEIRAEYLLTDRYNFLPYIDEIFGQVIWLNKIL